MAKTGTEHTFAAEVSLSEGVTIMGMNKPKDGAPGTTDQSPRWEGPQENTPPGYLPAKDDPDRAKDANGETNADPEIKQKGE
jgi:hypothetical protein